MSEVLRALLLLLPFLLLGLLAAVLWRPLRRMRERDQASPPSTRTLALRMLPFVVVMIAVGVWGLLTEDYEPVVYAVLGVPLFGAALLLHARQQRGG